MSDSGNPKKILVAVDGSPASENALKYSTFLASELGFELVAVYVVEEEKIGYWIFIDEHFKKEMKNKAQAVLDAAAATARERNLTLTTQIIQGGRPYEEIVKYLEKDTAITTVVMGERGQAHMDVRELGSTTERVIRQVAKLGIPVVVTVVPGIEAESPQCSIYGGPLCV